MDGQLEPQRMLLGSATGSFSKIMLTPKLKENQGG
jgi:hypothetical protein